MLVRLLPEQASAIWHIISPIIKDSLAPTSTGSDAVMKDILDALIKNRMQCWLVKEVVRVGDIRIYSIITTTISRDLITGEKSLLVYSMHGVRPMSKELWLELIVGLRKFARSVGCIKVVAYSSNNRVIEMAKNVGADASTIFLQLEV